MDDRLALRFGLREPGSVLLDTARPGAGQGVLFTHPLRELEARAGTDVLPVLDAANEAVNAGYYVAGFVSYEAGNVVVARRLLPAAGHRPS
jgi:hypothetical protein